MERPQYIQKADIAVIGAGVVGLAIAREFSQKGREVFVFESEKTFGMHTSSRNSEVVHSGVYYPEGSLKAHLCVAGRELIYEYCRNNEIQHERLGKIILATTESEIAVLENLKNQAEVNGVRDLFWISPSEVREREPEIKCVSALFSPSSGIVDSHSLMNSLKRDIEKNRSQILFSAPISEGAIFDDGVMLTFGEKEETHALFQLVINSAGLCAQEVAGRIDGFPKDKIPELFLAKGHYFILNQNSPFSHLVYPVPEAGGLGVHVTLDLVGRARFGPDVSWIDKIDYSFDENRAKMFYEAIRKYYPGLRGGSLSPGYTGIRPKLGLEGSGQKDFVIQGPEEHGVVGIVNLFGIESPGLTASLAIARYISKMLS